MLSMLGLRIGEPIVPAGDRFRAGFHTGSNVRTVSVVDHARVRVRPETLLWMPSIISDMCLSMQGRLGRRCSRDLPT